MVDLITEEIEHSPLGASGSGRWMHCAGSIGLAKRLGITHTKSGFAAKEGTAAHEILALCLENDPMREPWEFMGQTVDVEGEVFTVNQTMIDALHLCINHINEEIALAEQFGEVLRFIEVSMKHSKHDLMYGTTDAGIVALNRARRKVRISVNDLKYGAGVVVEPTSSQIKYYAELIVDRLITEGIIDNHEDVEEVRLSIMQPRIPHHEGLIRTITLTGPELESWYLHELVPAMKETENPDAALEMGEWCTFCLVKSQCPAMAQAILDMSAFLNPEKMTGAQLGEAIQKIEAIAKMGEHFRKLAFERAMKGDRIKGFKLVKKKANRQWRDIAEFDLIITFGDDAYEPRSLKTPPQVEKLPGGKTFVAQYAFTPQNTGLTLAPQSDSRVEAKPLMELLDGIEGDL